MNKNIQKFILNKTNSTLISKSELIQLLWGGYGELLKVKLDNEKISSAIIKYVILPFESNNSISHQRKVKSYEVEMNWYTYYSNLTNASCRVPKCFGVTKEENNFVIILEDLDNSGYPLRKRHVNITEAKVCLKWLANFHATFLNIEPTYLWKIGTYWHLDTRPEELEAMNDLDLKKLSKKIDSKLNDCSYKTFVHGDAKLANFCFSKDMTKTAVVDFQYVGGGCGMKDIAYFFDSAISEKQCIEYEEELLSYYFKELKEACNLLKKEINFEELEKEWRYLYSFCWADFYRFLSGWLPNHKHYNNHNSNLINQAIKQLS